MENIIGIDSGSSSIKIIEINEKNEILHKLMFEKEPVMKALDEFIKNQNVNLNNIKKIVITGVGKDEIEQDRIYNIETVKIDEFVSIGAGAIYLTQKKQAIVVSIGTGTAMVKVENNEIKHIGGTGVGGGTLFNLCKKFTGKSSFKEIEKAVEKGSLKNVDLRIEDVSKSGIKTLTNDITSSNFGKLNDKASVNDITLGIANMVLETVCMMAIFAIQNTNIKDIIIIGQLAKIPCINEVFKKLEKIYNVKFIVPENSELATALGAIKTAE